MKKKNIDTSIHKPQINFVIRLDSKTYFIAIESIVYIYLKAETVYLVDSAGNKHPIAKTISNLENLLPAQQFYRINRQIIVNRTAIKEIAPYRNQRRLLYLNIATPEQVVVPRLKLKHFMHWMENGQ